MTNATEPIMPRVVQNITAGQTLTRTVTWTAKPSGPVAQVVFALDGNTTTFTDTSAPYEYVLDTTTLANGAHRLGLTVTTLYGDRVAGPPDQIGTVTSPTRRRDRHQRGPAAESLCGRVAPAARAAAVGRVDLYRRARLAPTAVPVGGTLTWRLRVLDEELRGGDGRLRERRPPGRRRRPLAQADRGPGLRHDGRTELRRDLDWLSSECPLR